MNTSQKNFMVPLAFVGMMFFAIGFALGINSFLMPVLERSMEMSASESNLLLAATFGNKRHTNELDAEDLLGHCNDIRLF